MKQQNLKFLEKKEINNKIFLISFESNEENEDFLPGQFLSIKFSSEISRSYSIFSIEKKIIKILVDTSFGGFASKKFEDMNIGEVFSAILPIGKFILQKNENKKVFISTGTGISPFIPMIKEIRKENSKIQISVFFGTQTVLNDFSKELLDEFENIDLTICVSKENLNQEFNKNLRIKSGRITENFDPKNFDLERTDFYICGHPEMVSDVVKILQNAKAKNIFFEKY
ncbi:MAG: hypothetical protein Fur0024_4070 [Patescibacteria group bacterium]